MNRLIDHCRRMLIPRHSFDDMKFNSLIALDAFRLVVDMKNRCLGVTMITKSTPHPGWNEWSFHWGDDWIVTLTDSPNGPDGRCMLRMTIDGGDMHARLADVNGEACIAMLMGMRESARP